MILNTITATHLRLYDKHLHLLTYLILDFIDLKSELAYRDIMYNMKDDFVDHVRNKLSNRHGTNMNDKPFKILKVYNEFTTFVCTCVIKNGNTVSNVHYDFSSIISIEG